MQGTKFNPACQGLYSYFRDYVTPNVCQYIKSYPQFVDNYVDNLWITQEGKVFPYSCPHLFRVIHNLSTSYPHFFTPKLLPFNVVV